MLRRSPGRKACRHVVPRACITLVMLLPATTALAQAPFTAVASPAPVVLQAGGATVNVTVTTTVMTDFRDLISYSISGFPAEIATGGPRIVQPPFAPETFAFSATLSAAPGTHSGVLTGSTSSATISVPVTVIVQPAPLPQQPAIDAIMPPAVAAGTRENVLRISGRNFQPGAVISSAEPGVTVLSSRIISANVAEVVVAVRPDKAAGRYRVDLTNPDGATTGRGASLLVHAYGSRAGPAAVLAAQILTPRMQQIISDGDVVHAHALVAVAGSGQVTGSWMVDGIPFERFSATITGTGRIELRSRLPIPPSYTGEHSLQLAFDSPRNMTPVRMNYIQAADSRSRLRVIEPDTTARLDAESATFRWSLVPGASGYEVEVRYRPRGGAADVPWTVVRRRVNTTEWRPERALLVALSMSESSFRVRPAFPGDAFGDHTPWHPFSIAPDVSPGEVNDPGPEQPPLFGGPTDGLDPVWQRSSAVPRVIRKRQADRDPGHQLDFIAGNATSTGWAADDPPALTRLQLSGQGQSHGPWLDQQVTGDFATSHDLGDPWGSRAANRNWLASANVHRGAWQPGVQAGFAPPGFFDQAQLLTVFGGGGGVQGSLGSPVGRLSYYRSAALGGGEMTGVPEPDIDAAAYELSGSDARYLMRVTGLRAARPDDGFNPAGVGRGAGVLAAAELGPWLHLIGEAATGSYRPGAGSFDDDSDGSAFRLAATGMTSGTHYSLTFGRTGEGFVNPANPGFTPTGYSARTHAEFTVGRTIFDRASTSVTYGHTRGGVSQEGSDPRTTENMGSIQLTLPASERVVLSVAGSAAGQRGAAVESLGLPATNRTRLSLDLSATETFGNLSLSQAFGWHDLADRGNPWADEQMLTVNLGAHGSFSPHVSISAGISATRSAAAPEFGSTDHGLLFVQPSFSIGSTGLRIGPRAAFTYMSNDVQDFTSRTTQYQMVAGWTAPWTNFSLSAELATDWNRNSQSFETSPAGFADRTLLTVSLSWNATRRWGGP